MESYSRGPSYPLSEKTIHQAFRDTVERFPDREALVVCHQGVRLTWRELAEEVERTARGLIGLGLVPGDRVGVWATNCAEWIYLQLGCARAGLIQVNVNPAYRSHDLAYVLRKSGMKALVLRAADARSNYKALLEEAEASENLSLPHVVYLGEDSWAQMIEHGVDAGSEPSDQSGVVNIQYTSGTTGSPKGVLLTHRNLLNNGIVIAQGMRITEQDRVCVPVPMYHCFGCVAGTMVSVARGSAMILPAPSFDALLTMRAIEKERATAIYGVPTMFIAQLQHSGFLSFDFSSLRTGVMAGAPCPIEIMKQVVKDMHCPQMTIMYGQTESSPVITMANVDDPLELRVSTIGCACPETEVKIVSPEGKTLPAGVQGELCTRGYLVMAGYDQEPDATRNAIDSDGWLHTGDLSIMREDSYFRITGRMKDLIIRGGENVYPREVEEFLYTHPRISDVQVFGVPDERLGEAVAAWIRWKAGETANPAFDRIHEESCEHEIREFCRGKIAHFKIPQYIRFVSEFPMTVTGKVQKFVMRQREIEERGLEKAAGIRTA